MISGLWTAEAMKGFLKELAEKSFPLKALGRPINVLGDMTGFLTASRDTADLMGAQLHASVDHGMKKVAIYGMSMLVKLQYQRISNGLDVSFFDNKVDALRWLRDSSSSSD